MGRRQSPVGWYGFTGGALGFGLSLLMIWWMNARDYPIVIGGKPLFSPWSAFPVAFECAILFAVLGTLAGWLQQSRLPRLYHPLFRSERFARVTRDGFFLVIEAADPKFSEGETRRLLEAAGSTHLEEVNRESPARPQPLPAPCR